MRRILTILVLACAVLGTAASAAPVPASFFGMHVNSSQIAWPGVGFGSYRLWDDGTAWANLNPSNGVYSWAPLDAWVSKAQQHNVQLLYTFGRTPLWASSSPTTSCDYGPGQCVAPSNYTYWDNYVTALVTRYKGKIKYYELWNEPNDTGFWKGTTAQMVTMSNRAASIIHAIDPAALVVSPGATWSTTTAWAWLDTFLSNGGGPGIDVIGFHGYTGNNRAESIFTIVDNVQKVQAAHGLALPFLVTEGGWGTNTVITDTQAQAAFLVQRHLLTLARPAVQSFFWYQWDSPTWGTLWDSSTGIHPAGTAYAQLTSWITGANFLGCSEDAAYTWTCSFTLTNGNAAKAVWNAATPVSYTPGSAYTTESMIDGTSKAINGGTALTVSSAPVFFVAPVAAPPTAALALTPSSGIAPVAVSATVTPTVPAGVTLKSTSINFDDGTTASTATAAHTYTNPGSYTVTATVTDSLNRTASASSVVTVAANQPPVAVLSVTPANGKAPLAVTASATGSHDPDGSIASTSINFGDGTVVNAASASHTYTNAGTYTIIATVTDNLGATGTASVSVTAAGNQPPVAVLSVTPTTGKAPVAVTASTTGSHDPDGSIASTAINFGDGTVVNAASASHTYTTPGTYTITATVTDNNGATGTATTSVTAAANQPPVAAMTMTRTAPVSFKVVSTSSDPDGSIASTIINWGDGATTAATSGSHTYARAGSYPVTVTVTDNNGATATATATATPAWGVMVMSPASGSTVASPLHLSAQASSQYGIAATAILVDGKSAWTGSTWWIDATLTLTKGTHTLLINATDAKGVLYQSSLSVTVQ